MTVLTCLVSYLPPSQTDDIAERRAAKYKRYFIAIWEANGDPQKEYIYISHFENVMSWQSEAKWEYIL